MTRTTIGQRLRGRHLTLALCRENGLHVKPGASAEAGVEHAVWRAPDPGALRAAFREVPCCYIADGHHRAAASARVAGERRAANPRHCGAEAYNGFPAALFPAERILVHAPSLESVAKVVAAATGESAAAADQPEYQAIAAQMGTAGAAVLGPYAEHCATFDPTALLAGSAQPTNTRITWINRFTSISTRIVRRNSRTIKRPTPR